MSVPRNEEPRYCDYCGAELPPEGIWCDVCEQNSDEIEDEAWENNENE